MSRVIEVRLVAVCALKRRSVRSPRLFLAFTGWAATRVFAIQPSQLCQELALFPVDADIYVGILEAHNWESEEGGGGDVSKV